MHGHQNEAFLTKCAWIAGVNKAPSTAALSDVRSTVSTAGNYKDATMASLLQHSSKPRKVVAALIASGRLSAPAQPVPAASSAASIANEEGAQPNGAAASDSVRTAVPAVPYGLPEVIACQDAPKGMPVFLLSVMRGKLVVVGYAKLAVALVSALWTPLALQQSIAESLCTT